MRTLAVITLLLLSACSHAPKKPERKPVRLTLPTAPQPVSNNFYINFNAATGQASNASPAHIGAEPMLVPRAPQAQLTHEQEELILDGIFGTKEASEAEDVEQ